MKARPKKRFKFNTSLRNIKDQTNPKQGIKKLLWLAKTAD